MTLIKPKTSMLIPVLYQSHFILSFLNNAGLSFHVRCGRWLCEMKTFFLMVHSEFVCAFNRGFLMKVSTHMALIVCKILHSLRRSRS